MPCWIEVRPSNDTGEWSAIEDERTTLAALEDRARALVRAKIVTPDGVRIVWSPGSRPAEDQQVVARPTKEEST